MSQSESEDAPPYTGSGKASSARDVPLIVGTNLRRVRKSRGYSLERLAELSGVSRAMLGQIETAKSTPTVSLLWRIADALALPVKTLLATDSEPDILILQRASAERSVSGHDGLVTRDLMPNMGTGLRFLELHIPPGTHTAFPAFPLGTRQSLVVAAGQLSVQVGSDPPIDLMDGDAAVFEASEPFVARALSPSPVIAYLVVLPPKP